MLENNEISALIRLLTSDEMSQECLDFIEAHGYLTASIISPVETDITRLYEEILGEELSALGEQEQKVFRCGIETLQKEISRQLLMAEALEIPCELDVGIKDEPSDLERWCMAFAEKHFLDEEAWFSIDEEAVANLLLPIICGSGLVDDPEIDQLRSQPDLYISMLEDIPELAVDLYAFYHEQ